MSDRDAMLNVRVPTLLRGEIDTAADAIGVTRSAWVVEACEEKLDRTARPRPPSVVRTRGRVQIPQRACTHPVQLRSAEVNGEARCMACGSVFRRV